MSTPSKLIFYGDILIAGHFSLFQYAEVRSSDFSTGVQDTTKTTLSGILDVIDKLSRSQRYTGDLESLVPCRVIFWCLS